MEIEEEKKNTIKQHLKSIGERLKLVGTSGDQIALLEKMISLYNSSLDDSIKKSHLLYWSKKDSSLSLVCQRSLLKEEYSEYIQYQFINLLLSSLSNKPKRVSTHAPSNTISQKENKKKCPMGTVIIHNWSESQEESLNRLKLGKIHHWRNRQLSTEQYKLTFSLINSLVKLSRVSRGSIKWSVPSPSTYLGKDDIEEEECHLIIKGVGGDFFIDNRENFHYIKIYVHGRQFVEFTAWHLIDTYSGRLHLNVPGLGPNETYFIVIRADFTIRFHYNENPSPENYIYISNDKSECQFDLETCQMEYWSQQPCILPSLYFIKDVDHLLNLDRIKKGRPTEPIGESSLERLRKLDSYYDSFQRFTLIREIKTYFIKSIPYFTLYGKVLPITEGKDAIYTIYHNNQSIATFILDENTKEITFDLIDSVNSESINMREIYVY